MPRSTLPGLCHVRDQAAKNTRCWKFRLLDFTRAIERGRKLEMSAIELKTNRGIEFANRAPSSEKILEQGDHLRKQPFRATRDSNEAEAIRSNACRSHSKCACIPLS